jgi:tetratricopeptide (TPR) repeat protein
LIQQARAVRKLGHLDAAMELYASAGALGRAADEPELEARESLGIGIVARTKGNYPDARRYFSDALERATALELSDVVGMAHHGLLISAASAGDIESALVHGWAAFQRIGPDRERQADILINLAQLSADAGYPESALIGNLAALKRSESPRLRLPALAGAVTAAARLGDSTKLDELARMIDVETQAVTMPYETAQALSALATALCAVGQATAATTHRDRAREIARSFGFSELRYMLEGLDTRPSRTSTPVEPRWLSLESYSVVARLAEVNVSGVEANASDAVSSRWDSCSHTG